MLKKLSVALCVASAFGVGIAQADEPSNVVNIPLSQTFTVDFNALVKAGTCSFSVSSSQGSLDADGVLDVNLGVIRKDGTSKGNMIDLNFNLTACADSLFDAVTVKGNKGQVIQTEKGGNIVFYSDQQGEETWDPEAQGLSWNKQTEIGNETNVTKTKYVRFEQDDNTTLGTHTGQIVFTATYQ